MLNMKLFYVVLVRMGAVKIGSKHSPQIRLGGMKHQRVTDSKGKPTNQNINH